MGAEEEKDMANEFEFLKALESYRAKKESGDPEEIRRAEDALRDHVRAELMGRI